MLKDIERLHDTNMYARTIVSEHVHLRSVLVAHSMQIWLGGAALVDMVH